MQGEMKAYTCSAFRMAAVATIKASADTIRKSADRLIVFLSAISLFAIASYSSSLLIFSQKKLPVKSMLQCEKQKYSLCASAGVGGLEYHCREMEEENTNAVRGRTDFFSDFVASTLKSRGLRIGS